MVVIAICNFFSTFDYNRRGSSREGWEIAKIPEHFSQLSYIYNIWYLACKKFLANKKSSVP